MRPSDPANGFAAAPPALATVWPRSSYPLGANYDGTGTNFALFSEIAEKVELCLIGDDGQESRFNLDEVDGYVWHAYPPDSATAFGCTARSTLRQGIAATPASCCSTRTTSASTGSSSSTRRCTPTISPSPPRTPPRTARHPGVTRLDTP